MCHSPYILIGGVGVTKRFFVLFLFPWCSLVSWTVTCFVPPFLFWRIRLILLSRIVDPHSKVVVFFWKLIQEKVSTRYDMFRCRALVDCDFFGPVCERRDELVTRLFVTCNIPMSVWYDIFR